MKTGAFCCCSVVTVVCIVKKKKLNIFHFHIPSFLPFYANHKFSLPGTVSSKTLQVTARRWANGSVLQRTYKCVRDLHPKQFKQEFCCLYSFY